MWCRPSVLKPRHSNSTPHGFIYTVCLVKMSNLVHWFGFGFLNLKYNHSFCIFLLLCCCHEGTGTSFTGLWAQVSIMSSANSYNSAEITATNRVSSMWSRSCSWFRPLMTSLVLRRHRCIMWWINPSDLVWIHNDMWIFILRLTERKSSRWNALCVFTASGLCQAVLPVVSHRAPSISPDGRQQYEPCPRQPLHLCDMWHRLQASQTMPSNQRVQPSTQTGPCALSPLPAPINKTNSHEIGQPLCGGTGNQMCGIRQRQPYCLSAWTLQARCLGQGGQDVQCTQLQGSTCTVSVYEWGGTQW